MIILALFGLVVLLCGIAGGLIVVLMKIDKMEKEEMEEHYERRNRTN